MAGMEFLFSAEKLSQSISTIILHCKNSECSRCFMYQSLGGAPEACMLGYGNSPRDWEDTLKRYTDEYGKEEA